MQLIVLAFFVGGIAIRGKSATGDKRRRCLLLGPVWLCSSRIVLFYSEEFLGSRILVVFFLRFCDCVSADKLVNRFFSGVSRRSNLCELLLKRSFYLLYEGL